MIALLVLASPAAWAGSLPGYYRFPALSGDTLVFTAEGDLWTVGIEGGVARRLTSHPGEETDAAISPDGLTLAFSATYEGPVEVYTMPLAGGLPRRWTYEAEPSRVVGFTPQGRLLYSTRAYSTLPDPLLVSLDLSSGSRRLVPLSQASDGVYDAAGRTLYFARPGFHRNNTRHYRGGTARHIWRFREGEDEALNLTADYPGESHSPLWWKGRVYFVSDRDGTMNIWSMDEQGGDLRQHTHHQGWDVREPNLDRGRIVYRLGADLWLLEITSGKTRPIPLFLASDFDQLREKWIHRPMEYLTSAHLSPDGSRVVLTSRGRVFVAPARGPGRLVRASLKAGIRYRDAVFLPGGQRLLVLSDESGELEFHTLAADGIGPEHSLTHDGRILRYQGHPSPDGRWVAFADKNEDLWLLEMSGGPARRISSNREGIGELAWSPDSRWLAYVMEAPNHYRQLYLYDIEKKVSTALTTDRVNSVSPAFSPDGDFLYFLSDRHLRSLVRSPWGPRQPEPFFDKSVKIYQMALAKGLVSPFQPRDELSAQEAGPKGAASTSIRVDLEGIGRRLRVVPVPAGNYRSLSLNSKALFWLEGEADPQAPLKLRALEVSREEPQAKTLLEKVRSYELSLDGRQLLVRRKENLYLVPALPAKPAKLEKLRVELKDWSFSIDVRQDFRQLFQDAWRLERDYFYDPGMHGLDWNGVREKYLPLVRRVTTRQELSDLIGQMVSELSALHVSVRGGDMRRGPDQIVVAALGARLLREESLGGYRIEHIYRSDPDYPEELSPLAAPGLEVEDGDILLAVNGVDVLSVTHPNALLRNQEKRPVRIRVRSFRTSQVKEWMVHPTTREADLRYRDWEYSRRQRVEKRAGGKIGYLHLRAMGGRDLAQWYRNYYPVFRRSGLILDMRHNRGGNIDSIILEKLLRRAWFYWAGRVGEPTWNMQYAFRGHMVVLCDAQTASDGEAFTEGFRRLGLGKVIGTRTWGGEIWLSDINLLTDRGLARAPQSGVYGPERKWLIEGHGVDPDVVVDNLPHATFEGEDAQLDAAIAYLAEQIRKDPRPVPSPPPYPDKSGRRREKR